MLLFPVGRSAPVLSFNSALRKRKINTFILFSVDFFSREMSFMKLMRIRHSKLPVYFLSCLPSVELCCVVGDVCSAGAAVVDTVCCAVVDSAGTPFGNRLKNKKTLGSRQSRKAIKDRV